ncbi:MAG: nucleoside triphosphate pyrophosphohydrolase [Methylobacterium sp.]|uniref:nucleoside triphosphate pyrophosphohydrolase n=1 Tax=Methylobacterium sp. TaxID=409 RepID=UPI0027180476|nr:nucleoside triphosphate pyrophosphohydrolase [Methylobacterium sp.]MDO9426802.1 nucleoside triphosphate pyrophosphohydrolase [Methylobacterium sp.]
MRSGVARERLFGSVAAWLNNELTRGQAARLTCEWVTDNKHLYLVQVDQEDEDVDGVNPFQLRIGPVHRSDPTTSGSFLRPAEGEALQDWDKLKVLEELWESGATHKPTLFYTPLAALPKMAMLDARTALEQDFRSLIGPDNIIVRTSVRAGAEKVPNLPRTECVDPAEAAAWCLAERAKLAQGEVGPDDLAFVAHRFVPAPAAAWARAEPDNPVVEVHSLWGLPDALQYCPYDIWEVHIPTGFATEYPDYKSNMLIPRNNSGWEYVRIKNELARALSIGRREAVDVATRTAVIAQQLGRACHIMWFVGCTDWDGTHFNLPWYWTEAHVAQKNIDRTSYRVFRVANTTNLQEFLRHDGPRARQALELSPTDLDLMRDTKFIDAVGKAAKDAGVPVILAGSTLAHAYFQLRKQGCAVISPGEKEHSRARRSTVLGKLVRDKIPARITQRQEAEITRRLPSGSIKGFLLSKLLEEALEVRNAEDRSEKIIELADLYEVVLALIHAEGLSLGDVVAAADVKRAQAGGFEEGLVLMQTAILGRDRSTLQESTRTGTQVLGRKISEQEFEIPFTFFGFAEMDQPRSLTFGSLGIRLDLVLKADRIELRASKEAEQLDLPLDLTIGADSTLE